MYTKEQIEEKCKDMPWLAYRQGLQDGYNSAYNSLRNKAAVAAMQSLIVSSYESLIAASKKSGYSVERCAAIKAVSFADALVAELRGKEG